MNDSLQNTEKMKTIINAFFLVIMLLTSCTPDIEPQTEALITTITPTIETTRVPTPTQRSWSWSNDLFTVDDMVVLSKNEVWVIGDKGTIIHDYPRYKWDAIPYDYAGELNISVGPLTAIDFISPNDGWLASYWGEIFHWNGQKWISIVPYNIKTIRHWYVMKFANSNLGWMIGCDIKGDSYSPSIMQWNGIVWINFPISGIINDGYCLTAIDVISDTDAWVLGSDRAGYLKTHTQGNPIVLLHWNGIEWRIFPTPTSMKGWGYEGWSDISATNPSDVWIVNGDGTNIAYWNGSTWDFTALPDFVGFRRTTPPPAILAVSTDNVWVSAGALYHWNGNEWINCHFDTDDNFIVAIESDPQKNVYALTQRGGIIQLWSETK